MSTLHHQPGLTSGQRASSTIRRPILSYATRLLNPVIRKFAGSKRLRLFALIYHRGRRSGSLYTTPVGARPTPDGFIIPMTFGARADWFQNVLAAGGCIIQWNGATYPVVDPETIDWASARPAFHRIERALIPRLGITQFVRVCNAPGFGAQDTEAH
jgi:deazaflavin-dependent oxidoreductase (nitroreductase family)